MLLGFRCSKLKIRRQSILNFVVMEFQLILPLRPRKTMAIGYVTIDKSQVVLQFLHPMPSIIQAQVPEEILSMVNFLLMIPRIRPGLLGSKQREQTLILSLMLPNATPTILSMRCCLSDFHQEMVQPQVLELTRSIPEVGPWIDPMVPDQCLLIPDLKQISQDVVTNRHQLQSGEKPSIKPLSAHCRRVKLFPRYLVTVPGRVLMSVLLTLRKLVWLIPGLWH
ncbi:NS7a protein [White-eye coronavirus HKU16]|uniref:NS7a protein n=1 Tax=White-eye coronavirus HKU16 TaxID=1159907 RepID=H9BQZ7_9NIDO|nr:NS7a protein [White-eye coronavirus HKU16]AFD29206.1 NS7a protein [White-eye coronavirus HKU16]